MAAEFDPCAVDEHGLTQEALLDSWGRVDAYLRAHKRGQDDFYAYANLMRRLAEERRRRIRMGHVWLGAGNALPAELYRVESSGLGMLQVSQASPDLAMGPPRPLDSQLMTPSQFDAFLESQGVERVDARGFFAGQDPNNPRPLQVDTSAALLKRLRAAQPAGMALWGPPTPLFPWQGAGAGVAGVAGLPPVSSPLANVLAPPLAAPFSAPENLRGELGKLAFLSSRGRGHADLDAFYEVYKQQRLAALMQQNGGQSPTRAQINSLNLGANDRFPLFDVGMNRPQAGWDALYSVKTLEPDPRASLEFGGTGYSKDLSQILRSDKQFQQTLNLLSSIQGPLDAATLQQMSYLVVNADHQPLFRQWVLNHVVGQYNQYGGFIDGVLSAQPVTVEGTQYSSLEQLKQAKNKKLISAEQFRKALGPAAALAADKVVANEVTTPQLRALVQLRQQSLAVSERAFKHISDPALVEMMLRGGGSSGRAAVARASGVQGAKLGGVTAGVFSLGHALLSDDKRSATQRAVHVLYDTAGGAATGYATAWAETEARLLLSQALLRGAQSSNVALTAALLGESVETEAVALGASNAVFGGLGAGSKVFLSGAGGAIAAPLLTTGGMLIDDAFFGADYTGIDYGAKALRSSVAGGVSAGAGAIVSGAVAGSVAGPVGVLIGISVGALIYFVTDAAVGDDVESWARESMGEGGCPRG